MPFTKDKGISRNIILNNNKIHHLCSRITGYGLEDAPTAFSKGQNGPSILVVPIAKQLLITPLPSAAIPVVIARSAFAAYPQSGVK